MRSYTISGSPITTPATGNLLTIGFTKGVNADNGVLVRDAIADLNDLAITGGELCLLNGPASLPVAIAIGHAVSHVFGAVACFDPKMSSYIVAVAHGGRFAVGDLIPAASVS